VDAGVLYYIRARLSQAADAAALAGARSLSRGADIGAQTTSAQTVAANFFNANFPNGFWSCTVTYSPAAVWQDTTNSKIRYVKFTATATVPHYFMTALGFPSSTISSSATAARRDANLMMVLDRSGSMKNAIDQLVASALWFVGQFAPGRDKVGLVAFGGTYDLIKPTLTSIPTVNSAIQTLTSSTVGGTTNHSQPLWVAYQALAEANEPGALNAIVFFTDGQPNTVLADWSTKDGTTQNLRSPSNCNNGTTGSGSTLKYKPVVGYILTYSNNTIAGLFYSKDGGYPPYLPNSTTGPDTNYTAYESNAYDTGESGNNTGVKLPMVKSGCAFSSSTSNVASDFYQIPTKDYYGNATTAGYKSVTLTSIDGTNMTAAAYNAGDNAAARMRAGTLNGIVPLIDTIALSTTGATPETTYMKRLANTTDSGTYDSSKPAGLYKYVSTVADLQSAFVQIASQILHLSM
jgi:Flp pilus assembly protein TadG